MDVSKYSEEQRQYLRECYVGNETDTDQYRETQPSAGLAMLADLSQRLEGENMGEIMSAVAAWASGHDGRYGGAEAIAPVYGRYFDLLWAQGEHPYYGSTDEIDEWLADTDEGH